MGNVERLLTSALRCFTVNVEWKRYSLFFLKSSQSFQEKEGSFLNSEESLR